MPDPVTPTEPTPLEKITQTIESSTATAVAQAVAPINEQMGELKQQIEELKKPQNRNQSKMFGGPGIREGEDTMSSRGYQYTRLLFALNSGDWSEAKVEHDLGGRLKQRYGGSGELGKGSVLAPFASDHLAQQGVDAALVVECQQLVRAGIGGSDRAEMMAIARQTGRVSQAMSIYDDGAGAVFLGGTEHGELIDMLRAKEIFAQLGVRELAMPTNGQLALPKQTAGTTGYWVGEGVAITESEIGTDKVKLGVKKLATLVKLPNELLRFSTSSIEQFVRGDIVAGQATKLNSSLFSGVGSEVAPKGLLNYTGLQTILASTVNTNGNTLEPQDLMRMMATVEEQNIDVASFALVMRPMMWAAVANRRADAVTADDAKGPFIFNASSADPSKGMPDSIQGIRAARSTSVSNTLTKGGSGATLTQVVGGAWNEYLIGRHGVMEFAVQGTGDTAFVNDETWLRAIQYVDGAPRRENAFVKIDDLLVS